MRKLCFVLLLATTCFKVQAGQTKEILWAMMDWPSYFQLRDGKPPATPEGLGNGTLDQVMAKIIAKLPTDYRHRFALIAPTSLDKEWATGNSFCYVGSFATPERDRLTYRSFVLPATAQQIIIRRQDEKRISADATTISLKTLTQRQDLTGLAEKGRLYGAAIDALLSAPGSNVKQLALARNGKVLELVSQAQADYTIERPQLLENLQKRGKLTDELTMIAIQELPNFTPTYVACTRNAWGQQVIRDLDLAIRNAIKEPGYRNDLYQQVPKSYLETHRKEADAIFNERSQRSDISD